MDESMEAATFWLATLGVVLGMGILLYGVSLNAGTSVNAPIMAGGIVLLLAISLHTIGIGLLGEPDGH